MKRVFFSLVILLFLLGLSSASAVASQRLIVRTTNLPLLQQTCLLNSCQVVRNLDGDLNQLFLVTVPDGASGNLVIAILQSLSGVLNVEQDIVRNLGVGRVEIVSVLQNADGRLIVSDAKEHGAEKCACYHSKPVDDGLLAKEDAQQLLLLSSQGA